MTTETPPVAGIAGRSASRATRKNGLKPNGLPIRPESMFLDPGSLFMLAILVGVTGWVLKGLMVTRHRLRSSERSAGPQLGDMETRLRNVEEATASLLSDVASLREKQRFMTRLQAASASLDTTGAPARAAGTDISPMSTQSIPVMPRTGKY